MTDSELVKIRHEAEEQIQKFKSFVNKYSVTLHSTAFDLSRIKRGTAEEIRRYQAFIKKLASIEIGGIYLNTSYPITWERQGPALFQITNIQHEVGGDSAKIKIYGEPGALRVRGLVNVHVIATEQKPKAWNWEEIPDSFGREIWDILFCVDCERVPIKQLPLYINFEYKSEAFYNLLKG
jgi:hypothetical protein